VEREGRLSERRGRRRKKGRRLTRKGRREKREERCQMTFGQALEQMWHGIKVRREGKKGYIYLVLPKNQRTHRAWIGWVDEGGMEQPWSCPVEDVLAEDWEIVPVTSAIERKTL
jgi:hypothetical protein